MLERIKDLIKKVGTPYEMFYPCGSYCGCFFPIYEVFPNLPKFKLPTEDPANSYDYGMEKIYENAVPVEKMELIAGDVIVSRFNNELHVALYINSDRIIHVFKNNKLRINRLRVLEKSITGFVRVK